MIVRAVARILAAVITLALRPFGWWDEHHSRHPGDPWETDADR